jgi:hypothetical protein
VHPATYEDGDHHSESRANAVACYDSALIEWISKAEIDEEYDDLVAHMTKVHKQIIDKRWIVSFGTNSTARDAPDALIASRRGVIKISTAGLGRSRKWQLWNGGGRI